MECEYGAVLRPSWFFFPLFLGGRGGGFYFVSLVATNLFSFLFGAFFFGGRGKRVGQMAKTISSSVGSLVRNFVYRYACFLSLHRGRRQVDDKPDVCLTRAKSSPIQTLAEALRDCA